MINFEPKLTLFSILNFMLHLSLLTLRTHGHCCSRECGMKPKNVLQGLEVQFKPKGWFRVVKLWRWLIVQPCDAASHVLTAYKGAPFEKKITFYNIESMQLCNSFAVLVSRASLFIVIKYKRLKPKLIRNKFPPKNINLDYFFGSRNNTN